MKDDYTHISMVLDRSGSMGQIKHDTIGGFNQFLEEQQREPGECTLTLLQFDSQGIDTLHDAAPVKGVAKLTENTYQPRGSTPLWDAIAEGVIRTGDQLHKMPEEARPAKVVFVVLTDGQENSSHKFKHGQVRDMVKHQTEVYKWQFVFLGANIDSYAVGGSIGTSAANVMHLASSGAGVKAAMKSTSSNLRRFRSNATPNMAYSEAQRDEQDRLGADNKGQKK